MSATGRKTPLEGVVATLESAAALDGPAKTAAKRVRNALPAGPVKEAVSGTWLGHAVHPMLTDVVIGCFLSASALDLLGGDRDGRAGERLIGLGIAAYAPTALAGANDWADTEPASDEVRRVGVVHATTNAVALALYAGSLAARRGGSRARSRALSAAGAAVLGAGGYLGGHLSFARGVGPDQTVFDPGPSEWTPAADASALSDGEPTRVVVEDTPVLMLRSGDDVLAIHDRCSHRGCSLASGEVDGGDVVCACHGSRFDLRDGSVKRGPATGPQPAFETRERDGRVELRLRGA